MKKPKTKSIQSRLDLTNISIIELLAEQKGIAFSSLVRIALIEYVEKNKHLLTSKGIQQ